MSETSENAQKFSSRGHAAPILRGMRGAAVPQPRPRPFLYIYLAVHVFESAVTFDHNYWDVRLILNEATQLGKD